MICLIITILVSLWLAPVEAQVQNYGANKQSFVSTHSNVWVGKAETYLNEITYMKTTFVQNNPNGSLSKGTFYLSRPDKMRIEYTSPQELVILSDGQYLIQYDPELDESSKADLEFTPASILLTNPVRFSGKVKVLDVTETGEDVLIKVARVGEEDMGSLTFRFQRYPFDLKGWSVLDHQGQRIIIHLSTEKTRPGTLDYSLFKLHRKKK